MVNYIESTKIKLPNDYFNNNKRKKNNMKRTAAFIIGFIIIVLATIAIRSCNSVADLAKKEFSASSLLKKYEAFKDLSAAIDKKRADIEVYKSEIESYPITDSEDKEYIQQRRAEMLGLISMHNELCAEYNSQMSKFNYRFTNAGDLPASNLEPLPREIKPYILTTK